MGPAELRRALPAAPAARRFARLARVLYGIRGFTQIALMAALFVMWKQYHVPFVRAFERCFVAGVLAHVTLGIAASILMSLARLQPLQMLLRHLLGVASIVIFGALHYVYRMGILQSAGVWAVIYVAARILVGRIESRAMSRFRTQGQAAGSSV